MPLGAAGIVIAYSGLTVLLSRWCFVLIAATRLAVFDIDISGSY